MWDEAEDNDIALSSNTIVLVCTSSTNVTTKQLPRPVGDALAASMKVQRPDRALHGLQRQVAKDDPPGGLG